MTANIFPSPEKVIALIDELGGSGGLRGMGALESAVLRPQMGSQQLRN